MGKRELYVHKRDAQVFRKRDTGHSSCVIAKQNYKIFKVDYIFLNLDIPVRRLQAFINSI